MQIEYLKLSKLKPYEKNPRNNADAVDAVANSIKSFGFRSPIVLDKNNVIICGHTRYAASKKLKLKEVPCVYADDLTDEQINAYRLADNKTAELAEWDIQLLDEELSDILDIDMTDFGFLDVDTDDTTEDAFVDDRAPSCQHNVFENQELLQFPGIGKYDIPEMQATQTVGDKWLRFCDHNEPDDLSEYIAHFYYDDYKFMSAWRDPNKYVDLLRQFKAVVAPDFSLYIDFPLALQILSCYRRQFVGAYWQHLGLDVIPDVVWGERRSFEFCFDGIPKHSVVAVSTVGVAGDNDWDGTKDTLFKDGYDEMMNRLEPTTVLFYGDMIEGLEGNIIRIPSFYEERRKMLNERVKANWKR